MDFYDKLFTSVLCVIVTVFCCFNVFCFAESYSYIDVQPVYVENLRPLNSVLSFSEPTYGYSFQLQAGSTYRVTADRSEIYYCFLSEFPVEGLSASSLKFNEPGSFEFVADSDSSLYFYNYSSSPQAINYLKVQKVVPSGISTAVESLVDNVGVNSIWNTFEIALPYVGVVVIAGFGFYLIFHNIKEISNGKENM